MLSITRIRFYACISTTNTNYTAFSEADVFYALAVAILVANDEVQLTVDTRNYFLQLLVMNRSKFHSNAKSLDKLETLSINWLGYFFKYFFFFLWIISTIIVRLKINTQVEWTQSARSSLHLRLHTKLTTLIRFVSPHQRSTLCRRGEQHPYNLEYKQNLPMDNARVFVIFQKPTFPCPMPASTVISALYRADFERGLCKNPCKKPLMPGTSCLFARIFR